MRKINQTMDEVIKKGQITMRSKLERRQLMYDLIQVLGATTCLIVSYIFIYFFPEQEVVQGLICLVGVFLVGVPILTTAIKGFKQKNLSDAMEILVSVAMIISVVNGEYTVALLIPLLLTIVHVIEEKCMVSSDDAIAGLQNLQASTAIKVQGEKEIEVSAKELCVGDYIIVRPGSAVPIDGKVIRGKSHINQQSLTGETMPVFITVGDTVLAGTLNIEGELYVEVVKPYENTAFQQIIQLLEKSQQGITKESRILDRFLVYYIPAVLLIATATWFITLDINRAVAVLVVSCPCGHMLIHSAPTISLLTTCIKKGILIRDVGFIDKLARVSHVFFDKTGTLTTGKLRVVEIIPCDNYTVADVAECALGLARRSNHPLSRTIAMMDYAEIEKNNYPDYEITEKMGMGVCGRIGESYALLGNEKLMNDYGLKVDSAIRGNTHSESYVAKNGHILGVIRFSDTLREQAKEMVETLYNMGIDDVALITGDHLSIAEEIKEKCGLSAVYAQQLPAQKQAIIEQAKKDGIVAFIGDGINDSLGLSTADVGIAMGVMGADAARASADVSIMNDDLRNIPFMLTVAMKTNTIVHENILIAFSTSFIMIVSAILGWISPLAGALLHNLGAFFVLINSTRILRVLIKN